MHEVRVQASNIRNRSRTERFCTRKRRRGDDAHHAHRGLITRGPARANTFQSHATVVLGMCAACHLRHSRDLVFRRERRREVLIEDCDEHVAIARTHGVIE
ncbi:hypothetical protein AKJ09_10712 [Labilithrix luteola]|uniref:Uncharacterized protein n=1 Tax=Labilithrix luteola TaxID=1391654 RepID=A0A0K1QE60_9BACT|nr:hypothetical protein AKJ09_10712 [Labilithrix luteola]